MAGPTTDRRAARSAVASLRNRAPPPRPVRPARRKSASSASASSESPPDAEAVKTLLWLACIGATAYGGYWYATKPGCGARDAVACPPAELEEGVGVMLKAVEVCPTAGYLCVDQRNQPPFRWPLDQ